MKCLIVISSVSICKVSLSTFKICMHKFKTVGENVTDLPCIICKSISRQLTLCIFSLEKCLSQLVKCNCQILVIYIMIFVN